MKIAQIILLCLFTLLFAVSCKKEEPLGNVDNIPGLGGDTWVPTSIDKWINDSLTIPYNIAVKYKWDQFEMLLNRTLVPPKEEKIIPVLNAIKKAVLYPFALASCNCFLISI